MTHVLAKTCSTLTFNVRLGECWKAPTYLQVCGILQWPGRVVRWLAGTDRVKCSSELRGTLSEQLVELGKNGGGGTLQADDFREKRRCVYGH